jgi:AcrR family transcriptional regulator
MRQNPIANGNQSGSNGSRHPGRPRSEAARVAILRSALRLLGKNGFANLTIEEIASHANVGKATVYRWWPNKAALIADAFSNSATRKLHFPDTGSLITDMSRQMRQLIKVFRSRRGRIVSAILAGGQSDEELMLAFRERFLWPRRQEAYATLRRGIRRGELKRNVDMDLLLDSLYGPIYMRFIIRHDRLTPGFVDALCAFVLSGAQAQKNRGPKQKKSRIKPILSQS